MSTWSTLPEGDHRVCATCRTAVRSYQYRFYPAESPQYERCIGLSWCSVCRIYTGAMVHVPRATVLTDALAPLTPEHRERLQRSEVRLIEYLDRRTQTESRTDR